MLYNLEKNKVCSKVDCQECPSFDKKTKTCKGFGKICFEYDPITNTALDPITRLPIKKEE